MLAIIHPWPLTEAQQADILGLGHLILQLASASPGPHRTQEAIAVALDGAILRAQMEKNAAPALDALERILRALIKG